MTEVPTPPPATTDAATVRANEAKWGALWQPWVGIPTALIDAQADLSLKPLDLVILLHLVRRWWKVKGLPYPSKKAMAEAVGVDPATIQRSLRRMRRLNLITRQPRRNDDGGYASSAYDLTNLVAALTAWSAKQAEEKVKRKGKGRRKPAKETTI